MEPGLLGILCDKKKEKEGEEEEEQEPKAVFTPRASHEAKVAAEWSERQVTPSERFPCGALANLELQEAKGRQM